MTLRLETLIVSNHPCKSGGCRNCGIDDLMFLFCHAILQDLVIKGSFGFVARSPLM